MLALFLHAWILGAMLWIEKRSASRLPPIRAALLWYLLGVPLVAIEATVPGLWRFLFLQGLVAMLFFLPPTYVAFRLAKRRHAIAIPFVLFLAGSCLMGLVAGLVLAQTPFALGTPWGT